MSLSAPNEPMQCGNGPGTSLVSPTVTILNNGYPTSVLNANQPTHTADTANGSGSPTHGAGPPSRNRNSKGTQGDTIQLIFVLWPVVQSPLHPAFIVFVILQVFENI